MSTIVKVCEVYDNVLKESNIEICFTRNNTTYMGALFWKINDTPYLKINKCLDKVEVSDEDAEREDKLVVRAYKNFCEDYNLKYFKDTKKTMLHWMHVNGFTDFIHPTWEM